MGVIVTAGTHNNVGACSWRRLKRRAMHIHMLNRIQREIRFFLFRSALYRARRLLSRFGGAIGAICFGTASGGGKVSLELPTTWQDSLPFKQLEAETDHVH